MRISQAGLDLISSFEGLALKTYADPVGVLTIGFGHTGPDVHQGLVITKARAFELLREDTSGAAAQVDRLVTPPLSSGCLAGVVRSLLVEGGLAGEDDIPVSALADVEEAFLTSSTREVQPIDRLDGRALPPPFRHADDAMQLLRSCWKNSPDP